MKEEYKVAARRAKKLRDLERRALAVIVEADYAGNFRWYMKTEKRDEEVFKIREAAAALHAPEKTT